MSPGPKRKRDSSVGEAQQTAAGRMTRSRTRHATAISPETPVEPIPSTSTATNRAIRGRSATPHRKPGRPPTRNIVPEAAVANEDEVHLSETEERAVTIVEPIPSSSTAATNRVRRHRSLDVTPHPRCSVGGRPPRTLVTEVPDDDDDDDDVDDFPLSEEEDGEMVTFTLTEPGPLIVTPEREEESQRINIETPEDQESVDVSIVDLTETPRPTAHAPRVNARPVEVDLTCEIDDEVFVVLEDINNPPRRTVNNPIVLGNSPPQRQRRSDLPCRHFRRYRGDLTLLPQRSQNDQNETSTSSAAKDTGSQPSTSKSADAQESSSEYHCPICLDSLTQIKSANIQMNSTMCGHVFCKPCITQVVASTKMCPTCRNDLRLDQLISIFL